MREPKHRVVIDVSTEGTERWDGVFRNVEHLQRELGAREVEIEVVLYGKAWPLAARPERGGEKSLHSKVEAAVKAGVRVAMCENTMRRHMLTKADLLPFIVTVPSGVSELVRKQTEHWAYLKPGP